MRIFVTGANGFIGKNLLQLLKNDEKNVLYGLSRNTIQISGVTILKGDILESAALEDIFSEYRFDVVVHLAAITAHDEIVDNKITTFDTNLRGTTNLLNCFNKYCRDAQFIYSSTGKVYGKTNQMPISESAVTDPTNILGKTKRITEEIIDFYSCPYNRYLIARIFNIYGPWQRRGFLVPTIIDQLKRQQVTLGAMKDYRDYLYVDDLLSAIVSCIEYGDRFAPVDYVNIGSGEPACVADIIREMEKALGRKIPVSIDDARIRKDETPVEFCLNTKLKTLTGWAPKYSLTEGIEQTLRIEGVM